MANSCVHRVPLQLKQEPLLEAIWEQRFELQQGVSGEILGGVLHQALRGEFPHIVRLPASDIPKPIRDADPRLRYLPTLRLESSADVPLAVHIGEGTVSLNNRRPYQGWREFSRRIRDLARVLQNTGLFLSTERFSLRYINLLQLQAPPSLAGLALELQLADRDLTTLPVHLRTEFQDAPFVQVVQIGSPAEVAIPGEDRRSGTIIDIETVRTVGAIEDLWRAMESELDEAHDRTHRLFFALLTDEALARLGPVYA